MKRRVITCIAIFCVATAAFGLNTPRRPGDRFDVTYPRLQALGGPNAAFVSGIETLQTNPAGLTRVDTQTGLTRLSGHVTGPVFSLISVGQAALDDPAVLLEDEAQNLLRGIHTSFDVGGPVGFAYVGSGVGFSVYNTTGAALTAPTPLSIRLSVTERLSLRGAYAADVPLNEDLEMALSLGFSLSSFVMGESRNDVQLIDAPDLINSLGLGLVTEAPFVLQTGVGLNLAALWSWRDALAVGLTVDNLYAPTVAFTYPSLNDYLGGGSDPSRTTGRIRPVISTGVRFDTPLGPLDRYFDGLDLYFGYRDMFDFIGTDPAENIALKLSLAGELTLLDIVRIGAGFSQGLPSLGAGIELGVVELRGAVFGREYSTQPGLRSLYNISFAVDVRR
ncbi:MAG: hypothetical protein ACLFNQ_11385 [Spirochaetaceae bacterium]